MCILGSPLATRKRWKMQMLRKRQCSLRRRVKTRKSFWFSKRMRSRVAKCIRVTRKRPSLKKQEGITLSENLHLDNGLLLLLQFLKNSGPPRKYILVWEKIVIPRFRFFEVAGHPQKNHAADLFNDTCVISNAFTFLRTSGIPRNVTIRGRGAKSAVPGATPRCPDRTFP